MTPATWAWVIGLVLVVAFDLWALVTKNVTLSEQFKRWVRSHRVVAVTLLLAYVALGAHLFLGLP